jgi:3-oxoadipate enol-lactonase
MPYVQSEGANLYWEAYGSGAPVLLIMGLSFTHEMWFRTLPALIPHYRAIVFDNRGMGRSSVPGGPYGIKMMARDAVAVLRAAGAEAAHVIGASMGGMIAQELALQFPKAVRSLVLGCTSHSGVLGRWPKFRAIPWRRSWERLDRMERENALVRLLYADGTPRERIEEDLRLRSNCNWSREGFRKQLGAILMWSAYRRLPSLRIPTLIVHGDEDRLVPARNGRTIARRIPGARLEILPNAGHIMTTDQPELCANLMLKFLAEQD